jgi:hypothetical protein
VEDCVADFGRFADRVELARESAVDFVFVVALLYIVAGLLCVLLVLMMKDRFRRRPQFAAWKRFDETHYWNPAAEDWMHIDNRP